MDVFLSWSGKKSQYVAEVLKEWLPFVVHGIKPWMSSRDLDPGTRWNQDINASLERSEFGIICLTKTNTIAPWIIFEAGALAKSLNKSRVCPYLIDIEPQEIEGPLVQFQSVFANKEDTWKLVLSMHKSMGFDNLSEAQLLKVFEKFWPELETSLSAAPTENDENQDLRTDRSMIEEVLQSVRSLSRTSNFIIENLENRQINKSDYRKDDNPPIIIDVSELQRPENKDYKVYLSENAPFQSLLDLLYNHLLHGQVDAHSYGEQWILINIYNGNIYEQWDSNRELGTSDLRPLKAVGIDSSKRLRLVLLSNSNLNHDDSV